MQKGEVISLIAIALFAAYLLVDRTWEVLKPKEPDPGMPFYTTAGPALKAKASKLIDELHCKKCHSLWARNPMQLSVSGLMRTTLDVPAPRLEGVGSLRSRDWLYRYFSTENPQQMLPSRLKKQFRMPSYAKLPEDERRALADFMSSLKVKRWYLMQTKKAEYEVVTGKPYSPEVAKAQAEK